MIDWSQFQDKDKVRLTFEGEWREGKFYLSDRIWFGKSGTLKSATSATLVERPWTPPARGKLFKSGGGFIYQSLGPEGFRTIRDAAGDPVEESGTWEWPERRWMSDIEILDI